MKGNFVSIGKTLFTVLREVVGTSVTGKDIIDYPASKIITGDDRNIFIDGNYVVDTKNLEESGFLEAILKVLHSLKAIVVSQCYATRMVARWNVTPVPQLFLRTIQTPINTTNR